MRTSTKECRGNALTTTSSLMTKALATRTMVAKFGTITKTKISKQTPNQPPPNVANSPKKNSTTFKNSWWPMHRRRSLQGPQQPPKKLVLLPKWTNKSRKISWTNFITIWMLKKMIWRMLKIKLTALMGTNLSASTSSRLCMRNTRFKHPKCQLFHKLTPSQRSVMQVKSHLTWLKCAFKRDKTRSSSKRMSIWLSPRQCKSLQWKKMSLWPLQTKILLSTKRKCKLINSKVQKKTKLMETDP